MTICPRWLVALASRSRSLAHRLKQHLWTMMRMKNSPMRTKRRRKKEKEKMEMKKMRKRKTRTKKRKRRRTTGHRRQRWESTFYSNRITTVSRSNSSLLRRHLPSRSQKAHHKLHCLVLSLPLRHPRCSSLRRLPVSHCLVRKLLNRSSGNHHSSQHLCLANSPDLRSQLRQHRASRLHERKQTFVRQAPFDHHQHLATDRQREGSLLRLAAP